MKIADMEVTYVDGCGSDLNVCNAARVSFHKVSEEFTEKDSKLIAYLYKHKHFSPFNHAFLSFRVKAPIFVARQLVKHKFMPWNEVSRRYVDEEPEFYFPNGWRLKADNVKQGSSDVLHKGTSFDYIYWTPEKEVEGCTESALDTYRALLDEGICPEQARMVLPQNAMTEWIWSGTLGAFLDMLKLRLDTHTQQETRQVALKIAYFVESFFPHSFNAMMESTKQ